MNWAKGRKTKGRGTSFKGALQYVLHDKEAETDDRVGFVEMHNLATDDPKLAWREMMALCDAADDLKKRAGVKATGQKLKQPVYAFSLSWHVDDRPSDEHMLETALDALRTLGLENHQAVIAQHTDTAARHVHLIVNLVDPETGKAASLSNDGHKLDRWADDYEQAQGVIRSPGRRAKFEAMDLGRKPPKKDRSKDSREEWDARKAAKTNRAKQRADEIKAAYNAYVSRLKETQKTANLDRKAEADRLWQQYQADRKAIQDRHKASPTPATKPKKVDAAKVLDALTRSHSTFTRRDVVRHLDQMGLDQEAFRAAVEKIAASPSFVKLGKDAAGVERFTTTETQTLEARMLRHAEKLHSDRQHGSAAQMTRRDVFNGLSRLGAQQQKAVEHILGAEGLACIVGYAGAGKSTALGVAREGWEKAGFRVRGAALSGIAVDALQKGSQIDSATIHSLLNQWEKGHDKLTAKDVLVLDEAGMVGSRQMERVLGAARQAGAKVVLVGDPEQLQAIEAGGAFRSIADRFGAARIEEVRRQTHEWQRDATREMASGRTVEALARYESAGMVHAHDTKDDAKAALIGRWAEARKTDPHASQIILAYTKADVRDLNERARQTRRDAGELGTDRRLRTNQGNRTFATGDRIYFLKNDRKLGVRNGSLGTIARLHGDSVTVRMDGANAPLITFSLSEYADIDHGYAATVHKSQGVTVDRTHLFATRHMDRHSAYVGMSRHRERVDIHWSKDSISSRNRLASTFSRDGRKDTTLDYPGSKEPLQGLDGLKSAHPPNRQTAMHTELAKLAKEFQVRLDEMRGRHAADVAGERKTWRLLAEDRASIWKSHRDQFNGRGRANDAGPSPADQFQRASSEQDQGMHTEFGHAAQEQQTDSPWKQRRSASERKADGSYTGRSRDPGRTRSRDR
ncbi:AAA family ATPase [Methylobacterium sp. WSM2598]|uniref:AAA family ATPase n=1 Tax=Methylobacterium sp. WSM2598 TaxID=398261 RepID=UPI00039F3074|nr:AAA family ATPase [Methylobacterium sp. WSM2598]